MNWFCTGPEVPTVPRAVIVGMILLAAGCSHTMSVEEAKKVTVSMSSQSSFVPPPRRIDDISAVLEQQEQIDTDIILRLKREADPLTPSDGSAAFFFKRGFAANQIGRLDQALQDYREAVRLEPRNQRYLRAQANMEMRGGNFSDAITLLRRASNIKDDSSTYAHMVEAYALMGDLDSAKKRQADLNRLCNAYSKNESFNFWCRADRAVSEFYFLEAQGKFAEAEPYIRERVGLQETLQERPVAIIRQKIDLARNLLKQGRAIDAEIESRKVLRESLSVAGKNAAPTGLALSTLADALSAQGRLEDAEKLSEISVGIMDAAGLSKGSFFVNEAGMHLGNILFMQRDLVRALAQYDMSMQNMAHDQYMQTRYSRESPNYAMSLAVAGRLIEAAKIAEVSYLASVATFGEKHYRTAEWQGARGMVRFRQKDLKGAMTDLSAASEVLLSTDRDQIDASRIQRMNMVLDDYLDILIEIRGTVMEKELGIDAAGTAFRIADTVRGNTVQRAVAASSVRNAVSDPELSDLIRREQDAEKQAAVLSATLLDVATAPAAQQDTVLVNELRKKDASLQRARAALQQEIRKRFPKYAAFVNPEAASITRTRKSLHPGEALLSIYSAEDRTYLWAISHQGAYAFSVSPLGRNQLDRMVNDLRKSLDSHALTLGDIPPYDLNIAHDIYENVLKPVESGWRDATELLIVTAGPLARLPFSALPVSKQILGSDTAGLFSAYRTVPWLVRKVSITMLPSVNAFITLRSLPEGDPNRKMFTGFGDPIFNPEQLAAQGEKDNLQLARRGGALNVRGIRVSEKGDLDSSQIASSGLAQLNRLPDTAEEITDIARALSADLKQDVFLGKNASERTVKTLNLADRKVIAFASHALVPGDLDGLEQPALALSSPDVTGDAEDGLLTMGEIMKLKLNADWIVLSACNTGAAEGKGAEAVTGLGRAFFYAGTRSLLVSMWPVETTSAKKLVTDVFKGQGEDRRLNRARSLQRSMISLLDNKTMNDMTTGTVIASYAHPLFWAPFIMVGDPGSAGGSRAEHTPH